jgi:hypothetical protein
MRCETFKKKVANQSKVIPCCFGSNDLGEWGTSATLHEQESLSVHKQARQVKILHVAPKLAEVW